MTTHKRVRAAKMAAAQKKAQRMEKIVSFIKKALPVFLFAALFILPESAFAAASATQTVGRTLADAICKIIPIFTPIGYAAAALIAIVSLVQFIGGNREGIPKAITVVIAAIVIANASNIIGAMDPEFATCFTNSTT
jgi:Fe2+ transport system protein B